MAISIPVAITISRASAESAWKKSRAEGRDVDPADLDITIEWSDQCSEEQQRAFAHWMLDSMREADTDETAEAMGQSS